MQCAYLCLGYSNILKKNWLVTSYTILTQPVLTGINQLNWLNMLISSKILANYLNRVNSDDILDIAKDKAGYLNAIGEESRRWQRGLR